MKLAYLETKMGLAELVEAYFIVEKGHQNRIISE